MVLENDGEVQLDRPCEKERLLQRVKEGRNILQTVKMRDATWIGHSLGKNCLSEKCYYRKDRRNYKLKEEALD